MDRRSPGDVAALDAAAQKLTRASTGAQFREIRFTFLAGIGIASANPYFTDAITLALDGLFHPIPEKFIQRAWPNLIERFTEVTVRSSGETSPRECAFAHSSLMTSLKRSTME
ncbi:hypothetical protein AJ87_41900 [Rhizobium yanglingense]|nr:hypothetical protein AJ87_41900 [Rhizobium yanglingense]